ncbi:MAG: DUF4097 family beta strand repeat protein [Clostridia bacterium]|nr:DUF4097 family beta strand repeat protein [Clostridia bacterium]
MRATSVIFLIISVVLALVGVLTCSIGANMAEEQGIALFDQVPDADNNLIYTHNYTGDGVKKIAIDVGDAEINVYGGSETAYIELINFSESEYDLSTSNLTLSVVDNSSLLRMLEWGENGINFHGFRHFFHSLDFSDKPRAINIYVTTDSAVKAFDLSVGNGSITMQDIEMDFDLTLSLDRGAVKFENLHSTSDFNLTVGQGSLEVIDSVSRGIRLETGTADVDFSGYDVMRYMTVELDKGDFTFSPTQANFAGYFLQLNAPKGEIVCFGKTVDDGYTESNTADEESKISITVKDGDLTIDDKKVAVQE